MPFCKSPVITSTGHQRWAGEEARRLLRPNPKRTDLGCPATRASPTLAGIIASIAVVSVQAQTPVPPARAAERPAEPAAIRGQRVR
jgi:hypothetical protein